MAWLAFSWACFSLIYSTGLNSGVMSDDVSFAQQRRRAFEPLPRDWPTTLAAIRAAEGAREGDVNAQRAERERVAKEADRWRGERNMTLEEQAEYAFGGGMQQCTDPVAIGALEENIKRLFRDALFGEAVDVPDPTLIDRLWEDMQAGGGDEG